MANLKNIWQWFGKKLIVILVGLVAIAFKQQHPDWPIPDTQTIKDLVFAFLGLHTATDIASLFSKPGSLAKVSDTLVEVLGKIAPTLKLSTSDINDVLAAGASVAPLSPGTCLGPFYTKDTVDKIAMARSLLASIGLKANPSDAEIDAVIKILNDLGIKS